jgi:2-polyprenyl-3-methyl-5-hydroxy-6-metoxy-1,4-benzoquinol methylase
MKKTIYRACPVCRNQDAESVTFICHEKELARLHCERCNCAFFNRFIPKKPKYDYTYNQLFFADSEINKAVVMSHKIVSYAKKMFENPTVFEIGVGNGMTLKRIQNAGIPCEGVDIDKKLCDYLKEKEHITVHAGGLEKLQLKTQFDIVYSSHVIEHFEEPDLFMLKARQLIRGAGFLYIDTPDLDCSNNCDQAWHHFKTRDPWEHACVFSPQALLTLANRHAFTAVTIERAPCFGSFQAILRKV